MPVKLDNQAIELEGPDLGALLMAANHRLQAAGRIVVEVHLEGDSLSGEVLAQRQEEPLGSRELALFSADPRELAVTVLDQVRGRLVEARQSQGEVADLLQQDKGPEAMQRFQDVIEAWLQTQQAMLSVSRLTDMDLTEMSIDGQTVAASTQELLAALQTLKSQVQNSDTVGIADAMAYEWPQLTDRWDRMIAEMIQKIEE